MRKVLGIIRYWKAPLITSILFLCSQVTGYAADVTLQWDANTEPDLAGYKIYYDTDSGEPYTPDVEDYADQGPSPITVPIGDLADPENPVYTLTGLDDDKAYFFVVTAYDTQDLESVYSNEENTGDAAIVTSITSSTADGYYNPHSGRILAKHLFLGAFQRFNRMCSHRKQAQGKAKKHQIPYKKGLT